MHFDTHESRRLFLQAITTSCVVISCQALKHRIKAPKQTDTEMTGVESKRRCKIFAAESNEEVALC